MTDLPADIRARVDEIRRRRYMGPQEGIQKRGGRAGLLSRRQLDVVRLAADGKSNEEIAAELFVELETVKTHMQRALERLDARSRAHAVAICFRQGLIE